MTDKREPNPNATIQLDQVDPNEVQLDDEAASVHPPLVTASTSGRPTPPPLPPMSPSSVSPEPIVGAPPAANKNRTVVIAIAFFVLLAVAITFGVKVGSLLRPKVPAASAVVATPLVPSAPATTAPAPHVITIRTIEMNEMDGG